MDRYERVVLPQEIYLKRYASVLEKDPEERKDLVQETLLRAFNHLDKLTEDGAVRGWLRTIMFNVNIDHIRERNPEGATLCSIEEAMENPADQPFLVVDPEQDKVDLWEAIGLLKGVDRKCIGLKAMGYTSKQIGAMLGMDHEAVKKRNQRNLDKLKEIMGEREATPNYGEGRTLPV